MPGVDDCLVRKGKQHGSDGPQQDLGISTRKIRAANRSGKQCVAHEQITLCVTGVADGQTDAARTMARCVENVNGAFTERKCLTRLVEMVDGRLTFHVKSEHPALFDHSVVQELIVFVEPDPDSQARLGCANPGDVIEMRVRKQNLRHVDSIALGRVEEAGDFVSRIDQHSGAGLLARDEIAVLVERRQGGSSNQHVQYDLAMVIAVVDDLLFGSKIRAAAKTAGATIAFARGRDAVGAAMRDKSPELILIDLEGQTGDAIEMIRLIRAEAGAGARIIGFGSHVNVERLEAAKQAGCDQALARSAFVNILPRLLAPSGAGAQ